MQARDQTLSNIVAWAMENDDIRVVLLTSSLVNPLAPVDDFSDLDIELVFRENAPYVNDNSWVGRFGRPIAMVEEDETCFDGVHAMKMVLYADQVKVDFKLFNEAAFSEAVHSSDLPEDWDIGYTVLVDKDGLTNSLQAPTYRVSIIRQPTAKRFAQLLNDFWWDTTYVAKCLARGDLFYARFMSENVIRTDYLVPLIEWYIASRHQWGITTNKHGRLFKKYVSPELWAQIERTFAGSDPAESWQALFACADLVHQLGTGLAQSLAYPYPATLEADIRSYLMTVKEKYTDTL